MNLDLILVVCHEDYQWRQVDECTDTWYKWAQPTERVELFLHSNLPLRLCKSETRWPMGWLYSCFVTFISTKALHWTCYSTCVLIICGCRAIQTVQRHHWHCWLCSYCHNIISLGSPLSYYYYIPGSSCCCGPRVTTVALVDIPSSAGKHKQRVWHCECMHTCT